MDPNFGYGIVGSVLVIANFLIGMPFAIVIWGPRFRGSLERRLNDLLYAKILFTGSVLLNAVWFAQAFFPPQRSNNTFLSWTTDSGTQFSVMFIGFLLLCASILAGLRRQGAGKRVLLVGQYFLLLLSSLCWILLLPYMLNRLPE